MLSWTTNRRDHHLLYYFLMSILLTKVADGKDDSNLYSLRNLINCYTEPRFHDYGQCLIHHQPTPSQTSPPMPPPSTSNGNSLAPVEGEINGLHGTMLLNTLLSKSPTNTNNDPGLNDQHSFNQIDFNHFCELVSLTAFFTAKKDIILVSSKEHQHLIDRYDDKECSDFLVKRMPDHTHASQHQTLNNRNKIDENIVHHWYIDTYDARVIQSSIEDWMNEGIQRFVLVCSLECTSLVLQIASVVQFYEMEPIFFVFYRTPLFILTKLPRMVIAMERQPIKTWNSSSSLKTRISNNRSHNSNDDNIISTFFNVYALDIFKRKWNIVNWTKVSERHFDESVQSPLRGYPINYFMEQTAKAGASWGRSTLRVVTIPEDPYIMVVKYSNVYDSEVNRCNTGRICWREDQSGGNNDQAFCCVGYLVDMLEQLEDDLMFDSYLYFINDNKYGEIVNGTWVGMVGDLVAGKADLVLASLTINSQRAAVVEFTNPFLVGGMILITMLEEKEIPFFNVEPFKSISVALWIAALTIPTLAIGLLVTTERATGKRYYWKESFLYIMGLVFQRDMGGKDPHRWSSKVIALSIAMFTLVIMSTYTAILTANSVTYTNNLPITGFDDVKIKQPSSEFRYGTVANSAYTQLFGNSDDPVWTRMSLFMKKYNFTNTTRAFEQLANGEIHALIHDYFIAYHNLAKDKECRFKFAGESIKDGGSGVAVSKGSDLAGQITNLILQYQDREFFLKLQQKWMENKCASTSTSSSSSGISVSESNGAEPIGKEYFGGLFVALCSVVFVSAIVFALEFYTRRRFWDN